MIPTDEAPVRARATPTEAVVPTTTAPSAAGDAPAGPDHAPAAADDGAGWQPLPRPARTVLMIGNGLVCTLAALAAQVPIGLFTPWNPVKIAVGVTVLFGLPAFGLWLGAKQYRYTAWHLGPDRFALRRGRLWQVETVVPTNRVQHVDLKRGPLERRFGLATLVVHTAGSEHGAVSLPCLDHDRAQQLRDRLARQLDDDDDA